MNMIDGNTTVRELLLTHPATYKILLSHGMCEDCKADPPPVPLSHFANKHCGGNLDDLITELMQVMGPG